MSERPEAEIEGDGLDNDQDGEVDEPQVTPPVDNEYVIPEPPTGSVPPGGTSTR